MADALVSRLGQVNGAGDSLALFMKVFAGEVLTAFEINNVALERTMVRSIPNGKSAQFPATGRADAEYHTPGAEITGGKIAHAEQVINIDQLLVSPTFIADIDDAMNHYDVRGIYSGESGLALAYRMDKNILQVGVSAARASNPITDLPGGTGLINAGYRTDSHALASGIFGAAQVLDENSVPEIGRSAFLRPAQYYLLAQNTDAINKLFGGQGSYADGNIVKIAGIDLVKTNNLPITNITTGLAKYQVNASNTAGLVMHKSAVGTVKLLDLSMQSDYDIRRQGTLIVARYAVGHGVLRPDAAVELKVA
jgi:hypothetical protein